jgi:hypothetical protein
MKIAKKTINQSFNSRGVPLVPDKLVGPPLPLKPEEFTKDELATRKTKEWTVKVTPTDDNSATFKIKVFIINGTESLRTTITWVKAMLKSVKGLAIQDPDATITLTEECCEGSALAAFNRALNSKRRDYVNLIEAEVSTVAPTPAGSLATRKEAARTAAAERYVLTKDDVLQCLKAVIENRAPFRALQRQKKWMKQNMRKPRWMDMRKFTALVQHINDEELPWLPPGRGPVQSLSEDELRGIYDNALPNHWVAEMEHQNFDPDTTTSQELVEFCERLEAAESRTGNNQPKSYDNKRSQEDSRKKAKTNNKPKESGLWCDIHQTDSHDTADCRANKAKAGSNKRDFKSKNKTWSRKADEAKTYTAAEINALIKKTVQAERKTWEKDAKAKRNAEEANQFDEVDIDTAFDAMSTDSINEVSV